MNIKLTFYAFIMLILLAACHNLKNTDKQVGGSAMESLEVKNNTIDSLLQWEETSFGLWRSKNGDLAIKTREGNDVGTFIDRYISELCCEGEKIKDIIDSATFKYLGSSFYKDKNHVYTHYSRLDGGNFWIVDNADVKTFEVIGNSCYAKDKNFIYGERAMQMPYIDYKTFKTCGDCGCYAKDKNAYFFWDTKIDPKQMQESDEGRNAFEQLAKL